MPERRMVGEARLHTVVDADGKTLSLGDTQADWILDQGLVTVSGYEKTAPAGARYTYEPVKGHTVDELNDLILAVPDLRECDFCRELGAGWRVNVRPFTLAMGRFSRPVFACDACVPLVRARDKPRLIDRMIEQTIAHAIAQGGEIAAHTARLRPEQTRRGLMPGVSEFVTAVLGHRQGHPEKIE